MVGIWFNDSYIIVRWETKILLRDKNYLCIWSYVSSIFILYRSHSYVWLISLSYVRNDVCIKLQLLYFEGENLIQWFLYNCEVWNENFVK